jgi:hypothetical protein
MARVARCSSSQDAKAGVVRQLGCAADGLGGPADDDKAADQEGNRRS